MNELQIEGKALRLARAFASTDATRPALNGIHVTQEYVEGCDGHMGVRVDLPIQNLTTLPAPDIVLPAATVKAIERQKGNVCLRVGDNVRVLSGEKHETETVAVPLDSPYPDMEQTWPKYESGTVFHVNPRKMAELFKAVADYTDTKRYDAWKPGVKITVNDPTKAILIEFDGGKAIVMPVRGKE